MGESDIVEDLHNDYSNIEWTFTEMVLNPLFVIPWLIIPPICATIAYLATQAGIIPPVYLAVPWITPPGLYAFLATGNNLMAGLVALLNVFIAFLIWTPFVISANRATLLD